MLEKADPFIPYPGLRTFERDENYLFFGRDRQTDELLRRLRQKRFLAVVGTSGSGKSSLVRAGLIHDLHCGNMVRTGSHWRIALFRPGDAPIVNLAKALNGADALGAVDQSSGDADINGDFMEITLQRSALGIIEAYRQARLANGINLLIVVDQFEELFRYKQDSRSGDASDLAAAFVKLLLRAADQRDVPIFVVITMRSDYLGDCAQFRDLPETINDGQYLIPRMKRDELKQAITGPAAVAGAEMTPQLLQRLLNDVGDDPDQLPILQHALMQTWNHWKQSDPESSKLQLRHYRKIGGMEKALSNHAERAFKELANGRLQEDGWRRQQIAQKLFKALTVKGPDNRETRRSANLGVLAKIVDVEERELASIIDVFRKPERSFLMPPKGETEELGSDTLIDISHESLIRNWSRLKRWVNEEAQSAALYRRLVESASLYRKKETTLYSGKGLQSALDWKARETPSEFWAENYGGGFNEAISFLELSKAERDREYAELELKFRWRKFRNAILMAVIVLFLTDIYSSGIKSFWGEMKIAIEDVLVRYFSFERGIKSAEWAIKIYMFFKTTSHLLLFLLASYLGAKLHRATTYDPIYKAIASDQGMVSHSPIRFQKQQAGLWRRSLAGLIDFIISMIAIITLEIGLVYIFEEVIPRSIVNEYIPLVITMLLSLPFLFFWLYESLMIRSKYKATLGKIVLGLKVADRNDNPLTLRRSMIRAVIKMLLGGIGFLFALFSNENLAFYDKLAKSRVIYQPRKYRRPYIGDHYELMGPSL